MRYLLRVVLTILITSACLDPVFGQAGLKGTVYEHTTGQPLEGITVTILPAGVHALTDARGIFFFKNNFSPADSVVFSALEYASQSFSVSGLGAINYRAELSAKSVELSGVTVSAYSGDQYQVISKTDIAMRGVNNSQEVLRIVPGLVIGQHQGGGKAEQIFLRGFDADHGTDFRLEADGMPINMVSHAHGQGFADSHFIIPETISNADFKKGPYAADKGDFATTGYVDFNTRNSLPGNLVKLEGGMFNTFRAVALVNLLPATRKDSQHSWYAATEYRYSDGYFDNPQHFNRFNFFTKYNAQLTKNTALTVSASTFYSKWDASGQIPDRAVAKGLIGYYGALDPFEGGVTGRTNVNVQLLTATRKGDLVKNQFYYSNYHFDLHTNFTFFLVDTANGDEIRQRENRHMAGYNGSYHHTGFAGSARVTTDAGLQVRADLTGNSELSHTADRYTLLNRVKLGDISELSVAPWAAVAVTFSPRVRLYAGVRYDQFYNRYHNRFAGDTTLPGTGIYTASAGTLSPKLSVHYFVDDRFQLYVNTGRGFHSNDTRAVVAVNRLSILPAAYSADLGTFFKPAPNLLVNIATWSIYLQQEFVYSGDGGDITFNGPTQRYGFDFSARYQPIKNWYADLDVNYAHGRAVNSPKGDNFIPLAPV